MADITKIHEALKYHFGFSSFKGNQLEIISSLLDGNDVFVLMPTGGGKSMCYQLPAVMSKGTALIISPLIALMKNQVDAMRHYSEDDGVAHFLNSSLNKASVEKVKDDVLSGKTKLLYVAPESLTKEDNIKFLQQVEISFYAVDEAHCISEWGHDFRPEYRRIRPIINEIGARPVIALTATATPKVQFDIQKCLGMLDAKVYRSSFNRQNLYYEVRPKTKNVDRDIITYIKNHPGQSGIIYCLSRKRVEELAEILNLNEIQALPYHAGMDSATRNANQDAFLMEKVNVIVATIAFGMGIDKPDVRFVIHYDIPKSLEGYYQETGRAGRDGGVGNCITFYSNKDLQKLDKLMQTKTSTEQEIGRQLLQETAQYAESSLCRRKILLHYFGEEYNEENCGNCDNCLHPAEKLEAAEELHLILETIKVLDGNYKIDHITNILAGRSSDPIRVKEHDKLETFGSLSDLDDKYVNTIIKHAIVEGYISRDMDNINIIHLTQKGEDFIKSPHSFKVTKDIEFSDADAVVEPRGGVGCAADPELFAMLKDLRNKTARKLNLPPYVIFQEPSLEAMATMYPVTEKELMNMPGVGKGKANRYGQEFIDLIKRHVELNDIIRPTDIRVRLVANKSKLKVQIIQAIDRNIDLEQIADDKNIEFDELLDELEAIVDAGTHININYYIDSILDKEHQEDIIDYFRESEVDDLEAAYEELGDDYTEVEIRLMRLKFLIDMGN